MCVCRPGSGESMNGLFQNFPETLGVASCIMNSEISTLMALKAAKVPDSRLKKRFFWTAQIFLTENKLKLINW